MGDSGSTGGGGNGEGTISIDRRCVVVCGVGVDESATSIMKVDVPLPEGVPEITPVDDRARPAGSAPELSDHE
jgi:hypothetical protein